MAYHIIIATERRKPVVTDLGIDTSRLAYDVEGQLHIHSDQALPDKDWSSDHFVMVVEWDLRSPYVNQIKGDYSTCKLRYAGWPQITEKDYVPPAADL